MVIASSKGPVTEGGSGQSAQLKMFVVLVLSQEDQSGTHRTVGQIARQQKSQGCQCLTSPTRI